jgi:hypothetical protein
MNVLPGALVEAKLKVAREKLILCGIATRWKYAVAAVIRKFESNNLSVTGISVLPPCRMRRFARAAADDRVVLQPE